MSVTPPENVGLAAAAPWWKTTGPLPLRPCVGCARPAPAAEVSVDVRCG